MANRLKNEQSPYLQQHAHNPVDWYAWGDEPFEKAKRENKPLLVSIGYAACHWCHVMERESFEDEATATYMNQHFINIKVDREEHPDVDHLYMDAVQAITGSGGWPLNVFVTPDRVPFYGGTYFPPRPLYGRNSWLQVLETIHNLWINKPGEIELQSSQMLQYLKQASQVGSRHAGDYNMDTCRKMAENLLKQADTVHGGFGSAPKFPGTMAIGFLLEYYHFTGDRAALDHALFSLEAMIKGGIYDQLGGGFARYATNNDWLVPHFEKMLYDNALLVIALCDAWKIEQRPIFKRAIEETIDFVERELKEPGGGFYSALDADSEGVEGKFYTWTWGELHEVLGENFNPVLKYFGAMENGNWEHTNILHIAVDESKAADESGLHEGEFRELIKEAKQKLLAARAKRTRPLTDDKSLLSWNALMNTALSKAGIALERGDYTARAVEHAKWMLDSFYTNGQLKHTWKKGAARIEANLDDYAYLIQALLQLASATGSNHAILKAQELAAIVESDFQHDEGNFFYFTSTKQKGIPVRKAELYDGATPSSNAVMAYNLMTLGLCMERFDWSEQAAYMLRQMAGSALRYTSSFGYWSILLQRAANGLQTIVCTGPEADELRSEIQRYFLPQIYVVTTKKEGVELPVAASKASEEKQLIYLCTADACLPPVSSADELWNMMNDIK